MLNAHTGVYIGQPVAAEFARSTHALNHAIGLPGQGGGARRKVCPRHCDRVYPAQSEGLTTGWAK